MDVKPCECKIIVETEPKEPNWANIEYCQMHLAAPDAYTSGYRKGVEDAAEIAILNCEWTHDKELFEDCACYGCTTSLSIRALLTVPDKTKGTP